MIDRHVEKYLPKKIETKVRGQANEEGIEGNLAHGIGWMKVAH